MKQAGKPLDLAQSGQVMSHRLYCAQSLPCGIFRTQPGLIPREMTTASDAFGRVARAFSLLDSRPFRFVGDTRSSPNLCGAAIPSHPETCGQTAAEIRSNLHVCRFPSIPSRGELHAQVTRCERGWLSFWRSSRARRDVSGIISDHTARAPDDVTFYWRACEDHSRQDIRSGGFHANQYGP
jgi:hypothetical protein